MNHEAVTQGTVETDQAGNSFALRPIDCPMCKRRNLKVLGNRGGRSHRFGAGVETTIVRCRQCGVLFPDPFPFPVDAQALYGDPGEYFSGHSTPTERERHHRVLDEATQRLGERFSVLDIGCGRGDLLHEAKQRGMTDLAGLDFAESMVRCAREQYGIEVSQVTAEQYVSDSGRQFDLVVLNAVIEHVYDPDSLVAAAAELCRPGGWLYSDTPRDPNLVTAVGNGLNRLRRSHAVYNLFPTWPPFYVFDFNPKSLEKILERHGFELVDLRCRAGKTTIPPGPGIKGKLTARLGSLVMKIGNATNTATNMDGWARRR